MSGIIEMRSVPGEVRMVDGADGKPAKIVGYSAVYNSLSEDLGGFREMVMPGAFTRALADAPDVRGKYNHEHLLGRTKSGTLRMADDAKGLRYEIDAPNTSIGRDVCESIRRGDVDGSSFCFRVRGSDGETWRKDNGGAVRELRQLELLDVGPVDSPAYLGTEGKVAVRSLPDASKAALAAILVPAAAEVMAKLGNAGGANLRHARIRLAEAFGPGALGETRFYLPDDSAGAALADACRQASSALDSVVSLSWKSNDLDAAKPAVMDALTLCGALSAVAGCPDSGVIGDLATVTETALKNCIMACQGIDHPVTKLAAVVCAAAAEQCAALAGNTEG